MRKLYALLATVLVASFTFGQTSPPPPSNPAPQQLPYSQDFSTLSASSTIYPEGWQGWVIGSAASTFFRTSEPTTDRTLAIGTASSNSGNVYNYDGKIGFLVSGSIDPAIVLSIKTTGQTDIQAQYDIMTIRNPYTLSGGRINEVTLQYRIGTSGAFTTVPNTLYQNNTKTQTTSTTAPQNPQTKIVVLPASCNNQPVVHLRWVSRDISGGGGRPSFAVDNISVSGTTANTDAAAPQIALLAPANNATNVAISSAAIITFDENIQKGTAGNIYLKRKDNNAIVQMIDIASPAVSVSGKQVAFELTLVNSTNYYLTVDAGAFEDITGNDFAGINDNTTWSFTTVAPPQDGFLGKTYSFNTCGNYINEGFKTFNVSGAQTWTCTKFGRTYTTDPSLDSAIEMNGFSDGSKLNEDWLISPKFDLSGTTYPLLDFYSRSRFAGPSLTLKVSTDYTGSGDPSLATWTTLIGEFPEPNTNTWTLSDSINLSRFKTGNVHLAWVYASTTASASRWTLDDIKVYNSDKLPAPFLVVNEKALDFGFTAAGTLSGVKTISFSANNLTTDFTVTAPSNYEVSKDGTIYTSSVTFTTAETNNGQQTIYVRLLPVAVNTVYADYVKLQGKGISTDIWVKGNSYPLDLSLNVVNWNIEWFGSTGLGPSNEALQMANAKKVMDALDADVYAVAEIVSIPALEQLAGSLAKPYSFIAGQHCSGSATSCNSAQKLALVYKSDVLSNVSARALMISSATARTNWASGRVPLLVTADATKNGLTKKINFIIVHAKANTGDAADQRESYFERKAGIQELKDTLDQYFAGANVIILGDFNDDLDRTIAPTTGADTVSSYVPLIADSTDADHYLSVTLPLSLAKYASTTGFPDVIDHVVISNELSPRYIDLSASIVNDIEEVAGITDYAETTSDHYPVMSRFLFCQLTCPQDVLVQSEKGKCGATVDLNLSAITCGSVTAVPSSGSFFPVGKTTVTVTNSFGETCSFTVTVEDREAPIANTKTITVSLDENGKATVSAGDVNNNSEDACGIATLTLDKTSFDCSNMGENTVTLTVTDLHGNSAAAPVIITVADAIAPLVTTKNITVQLDANGRAVVMPSDIDNGSSDICGIRSITLDKDVFTCSDLGTNQVILIVTDKAGNVATGKAVVTVEDNIAPSITCTQPIVANPTSLSGARVMYATPVTTDNCGTPAIRQTAGLPSGAVFPIGITNNKFAVTDASGNTSSCSFSVTVKDPACDNTKANQKVYVCHNGNTICISVNALQAHLDKGSKLGRCDWYESGLPVQPLTKSEGAQKPDLANTFALAAYPNPFTRSVTVQYSTPVTADVSVKLYDLAGKELKVVYSGKRNAGVYNATISTSSLGAGVYYCRIIAVAEGKEHVQVQKLVKTN